MYHLNYFSISALMTIESSFIPFPSEVVIPPAAYAACNPENENLYITEYKLLNVFIVVLFGTLGALIGALINYFISLYLGRPLVYKFADSKLGHLLLLDSSKIKKVEDYFVKHGNISTFIGRLIPGIRQLISIPAGLAKMKLTPFITYTCLGAGIWNSMLAVLGYIAHGEQDIINTYSHELSYILLGLGVLLLFYVIIKGLKNKKK
ncbi:MAG: DedA family protein [Bacteroidales bacterium]|nr:DedA family protein [Bacteroidales bacterium]MDD4210227.1 DedA family protein [Bacteroidales bacterium]